MTQHIKVIIEKHPDGYVVYPLGLKGVIVGEGDTYEEALADVQSAIIFLIERFGADVLDDTASVLEVFIAEAGVEAKRSRRNFDDEQPRRYADESVQSSHRA